jgi:hypothetical protein
MKLAGIALAAVLLLPVAAHAQLTPSTQALWECAKANRWKPYDSGDSAAIVAACGTPNAVTATLAGGQTSFAALVALRAAARALWLTYVKTQVH